MALNLKSLATAFAGFIVYFVFFDYIETILATYVGDGFASLGVVVLPFIIFGVIVISAFTGNDGRGYNYEF